MWFSYPRSHENTARFGLQRVPAIVSHFRTFFDEYCSTVQGLLDWFEVDLGFTELSLISVPLGQRGRHGTAGKTSGLRFSVWGLRFRV